jgi:uncharacterized protein YkwD
VSPASPAPAAPPPPDPARLAAEIVAATNAVRAAHGYPGLAELPCATEQATSRVGRLVADNAFYHLDLNPVLQACSLTAVGENLALGYSDGAAAVDGWLNSPGHRDNLLGPFTHLGVSCQLQQGRWLCATLYASP